MDMKSHFKFPVVFGSLTLGNSTFFRFFSLFIAIDVAINSRWCIIKPSFSDKYLGKASS